MNLTAILVSSLFPAYRYYLVFLLSYSFASNLGLELLVCETSFKGISAVKLLLQLATLAGSILLLLLNYQPPQPFLLPIIHFGLFILLKFKKQLSRLKFLKVFSGCGWEAPTLVTQLLEGLTRSSYWLAVIVLSSLLDFRMLDQTYLQNLLLLRTLSRVIANQEQPVLSILLLAAGFSNFSIFLYWVPFQPTYLHLLAPFIAPKKTPVSPLAAAGCFVVNLLMTGWIWVGLPTRTLFGLPVYLPSLQFGECSEQRSFGREGQLFKNVIQELQVREGLQLIRISKWLVLARELQRGVFTRVVEFRVLEAQEMTSCHNEEAQTLDDLVQSLPRGESCSDCNTIVSLESKVRVSLHDQNEIKLTGIVQSEQFIQLFRGNYLSLLIYYFFKEDYLNKNPEGLLQLQRQFHQLTTHDAMYKQLPHRLIVELSLQQYFKEKAIVKSDSLKILRTQRPPASNNFLDDDDDLLGIARSKPVAPTADPVVSPQITFNIPEEKPSPFKAISTIFKLTVGSVQGSKQQRIYKWFDNQSQVSKTKVLSAWQPCGSLVKKAIRASFILTANRFIEGEFDKPSLADIMKHLSSPLLTSQRNRNARLTSRSSRTLWSLVFYEKEQRLGVVRYVYNELEGVRFSLHKSLAEAVWANQAFEMFFVHNDDDERYSAQSHKLLLRNILTQAGPLPLGYAPMYSGPIVSR